MSTPVYRRASRVILFDPYNRVLLSHDTWDGRQWWVLPGGGVEGGETPAEAAVREVREETGFDDVELGPVVIRHRFQMVFLDLHLDQDEWIFLGRTGGGDADMAGINEVEGTFMGGFRWWPSAELTASTEVIYPPGLPVIVASLLAGGPPATPWMVGSPPA